MPTLNEMIPSKYLKKEDFEEDTLLTIKGIEHEQVGGESGSMKYVMYFRELEKGLVLNATNIQMCAKAIGADNSDDWMGKKIVVFVDPSISFGGKIVGGLRIRGTRKPGKAPAAPVPIEELDDDIPF